MGKELLFSLFGVLTASVRIHCKTNTNILFLLFFPLPEETDPKNITKTNVKEYTAYIFFYKFYGFKSYT